MLTDEQLQTAREYALRHARRFRLADPEAAAQDAVVALWSAAERHTPERFEPWMYRIVKCRILDGVRYEIRHRTEELPAGFAECHDPPTPTLDFTRCAEAVGRKLTNLLIEGYSYAEIAERMDLTVDAIKGRLARHRSESSSTQRSGK